MHFPQQVISNQPQLFKLHKMGDSDPWEQEKYLPDMNEPKQYKVTSNYQPQIDQRITYTQQSQQQQQQYVQSQYSQQQSFQYQYQQQPQPLQQQQQQQQQTRQFAAPITVVQQQPQSKPIVSPVMIQPQPKFTQNSQIIQPQPQQYQQQQSQQQLANPQMVQPVQQSQLFQQQSQQQEIVQQQQQVQKQKKVQPEIKQPQQPEEQLEENSIQITEGFNFYNQLNCLEVSNLQETNPLAYFEYLQKKYMDSSPNKENKENIPKSQTQIETKEKKITPMHQPKPSLPQPQPLQKKAANFDTVYTQLAERIYNQSELENDFSGEQYQTGKGEIVNINEILLGKQDLVKIQQKNSVIKKIAENKVPGTVSRCNKSQISNYDMMTTEEKQLEQCTFAPKINSKGRSAKRRTIDQFIENQKQFQLQVEEKKNRLKDQIQQEKAEQCQKPQLYKVIIKSLQFLIKKSKTKKTDISSMDEKSNQSVYERLYSRANESQMNSTFQQDSQYMPQIGEKSRKIRRNEKIENLLYQDALRRQEVQKLNQDIKQHQEKLPVKKVVSSNTKKILIQKFLKDFECSMQQFFPSNTPQDFICKIDYLQLGEILKHLGFLQLHSCSEKPSFSNERTMLYEIWTLLRGDNFGGILKRNLCILLLAIQGLYCHFPTEKENESEYDGIGYFNEETQEWEVTQDDAKQLQQKFDALYRNKLQNEETKKIKYEEAYEFKPQISETSKVLAQHYRERLLEETATLLENNELDIKLPANGRISHTDLLVIQKQAQLAEHQKRQILQNEEELSQFSILSKPSQASSTGQHRTLELYKLAKPQHLRSDRSSQEIEYEKSMDVCTFQPTINRNFNKTKNNNNKQQQARNVDKTIERMRLARKERELLNQWKSRGVPNQNIILELNQLNEQFGCYPSVGSKNNFSMVSGNDQDYDEDCEQPFNHYSSHNQNQECGNYNEQSEGINLQQQQEEEDPQENEEDEDRVPLLFVDVNLGPQMADRIVVYEGDCAEQLAEEFAIKHNLDESLWGKLVELLNEQIRGLLTKIEEEEGSEAEEDEDYEDQ